MDLPVGNSLGNLGRRSPSASDSAMYGSIVAAMTVPSPAKNNVFATGLASASCASPAPAFP